MSNTTDIHNISNEFTCFSRLPRELQAEIWEIAAIPKPRHLHLVSKGLEDRNFGDSYDACIVRARDPIPPLLHTNHEARAAALAHYQVAFQDCPRMKPAYVNFGLDTVHVSHWQLLDFPQQCNELRAPLLPSNIDGDFDTRQQFYKFIINEVDIKFLKEPTTLSIEVLAMPGPSQVPIPNNWFRLVSNLIDGNSSSNIVAKFTIEGFGSIWTITI